MQHISFLVLATLAGVLSASRAAESVAPTSDSNLRAEVQKALDHGFEWLKTKQNPDGSFSNPEHPALTALPLVAFLRAPKGDPFVAAPEQIEKGFAFIRSKAKPDGSIYEKALSNYNTSVCLLALLERRDPGDEALTLRARDFIAGLQAKNLADESLDGGIGYGATAVSPKRQHPDLDNTMAALEAIRAYRDVHPQPEKASEDLNWQAAIDFISRCQNLPGSNPSPSTVPEDRGGFVYYPGFSNAAPTDGSDPLRSYGSMTYAGLLSFIYADVKKDDPRVQAALEWLKKNFSVDQNPGMGSAGYYYYLHLMGKGLTAAHVKELPLATGKSVNWAAEAARKLTALQQTDGSWINADSARFMERDPVLVTSYCLLTLEMLRDSL